MKAKKEELKHFLRWLRTYPSFLDKGFDTIIEAYFVNNPEQKLISEPQKGSDVDLNTSIETILFSAYETGKSNNVYFKDWFNRNNVLDRVKDLFTQHSLPIVSEPERGVTITMESEPNPVKEPEIWDGFKQCPDCNKMKLAGTICKNPITGLYDSPVGMVKEPSKGDEDVQLEVYPKNYHPNKDVTIYSNQEYHFQFRDSETGKGVSDFKIGGKELFDLLLKKEPKGDSVQTESESIEFAEWISDKGWVKKIHTHPNKVGQYYSDQFGFKTIQELYTLFKESKVDNK